MDGVRPQLHVVSVVRGSAVGRFKPIESEPRRLADRVYAQLLAAILSGDIRPGERLIQETLAAEIEVSRTPVREALLRLEREGIITNAGRQGFEVEEIDAQTVRDVYQAREAIEGYAARLVAERGDRTTFAWLEERLEAEGAEEASMESAYEANRRAHRAVVEATNNHYLVDLFDAVWGRAIALRLYADLYATLHRGAPIAHSHRPLWEALASGDGQRAHDEMIGHIRQGLDQQISALETGDRRAPISG